MNKIGEATFDFDFLSLSKVSIYVTASTPAAMTGVEATHKVAFIPSTFALHPCAASAYLEWPRNQLHAITSSNS